MHLRLSLLMVLQYAGPGAVLPLYSLYLKHLGFSPYVIGWVCATQSMGSLLAPIVIGQIADRWIAAERCLFVLASAAAILFWVFPSLTSPMWVLIVSFALWLMMAPAITLGTTICLTHLLTPERHYSQVRLWGTVGWLVINWLLGYWFRLPGTDLADAFRLASGLTVVLAGYALTLPPTPPRHCLGSVLAPIEALGMLRDRSFAVFMIGSMTICMTGSFYSQNLPLLLEHLDVSRPWIPPLQTVGQISEVATMALLPMILLRLEMRGSMIVGLGVWAVGLGVLAIGRPLGLVVPAFATWGAAVSCYLVAGQVFVNGRAHGSIRTSVQALMTCCNSLGMLVSNVLSGWIRSNADGALGPVFTTATVMAAGAWLVFVLGFKPSSMEGDVRR